MTKKSESKITLCPFSLIPVTLHQEGTKMPQNSREMREMKVVSEGGSQVIFTFVVSEEEKAESSRNSNMALKIKLF